MQNGFPLASKKFWPRPDENSNGQDGLTIICCFSNLFHNGNTKSRPDEVFDPELTEPDLNGVKCGLQNNTYIHRCGKEDEAWDLIPWSGSLHWSHFGRLSCCRALEVWQVPLQSGPILQVLVHKNGFTELAYLKSDSQRNVPPSSVNSFPSIGAKQSLWHGLQQQHWTTFNNLQIKQPRWSSLPPTFSQL